MDRSLYKGDDEWTSARLISVNGDLRLEIDVEELAADSGYLELWIMNGDVSVLRGVLDIWVHRLGS
jgi:hypothetical protein